MTGFGCDHLRKAEPYLKTFLKPGQLRYVYGLQKKVRVAFDRFRWTEVKVSRGILPYREMDVMYEEYLRLMRSMAKVLTGGDIAACENLVFQGKRPRSWLLMPVV